MAVGRCRTRPDHGCAAILTHRRHAHASHLRRLTPRVAQPVYYKSPDAVVRPGDIVWGPTLQALRSPIEVLAPGRQQKKNAELAEVCGGKGAAIPSSVMTG